MKRILRTISILLVLTISCSLFSVNAFAQVQQTSLEAAKLLYGLKITDISPKQENMNIVLTRAEFLSILMTIEKGVSYSEGDAEPTEDSVTNQYFTDVTPEHAHIGDVNMAYELGIIKGDGSGEFRPDYPITYMQAVVMILRYLGYEAVAERKGGYWAGYSLVAAQTDLSDGLSCGNNDILRYTDVCKLIANALEVRMVTFEGVEGDSVITGTEEGCTLLTEKLKLRKATGVIKGNENTLLYENTTIREGGVLIDDKVFSVGESGAADYLGYTVDYYYDISDASSSEPTLIYITPGRENTTITINSKDIQGKSGLPNPQLTYMNEQGKKVTAKISKYADLIKNGVSIGVWDGDDMVPDYGSVTLVDNDRDGTYDLLLVWNYKTILVGDISSSEYTVYDYYDYSSVSLDTSHRNTVDIYSGRDRKKFANIKAMQVLSVAEGISASKKHTTVLISTDSITGEVECEARDDGEITVNGKEYEVVPGVFTKVKALELGVSGTFYLDSFGRIAGYIPGEVELKKNSYGYLLNAGLTKGINPVLQLRMMTDVGIKTYNVAQKVLVDDTPYKKVPGTVLSLLGGHPVAAGSKASEYAQLIRYSLNADDCVTMIDTAPSYGSTVDKDNENNKLSLDVEKGSSQRRYQRPTRALGTAYPEIAMNESTVVFKLPAVGREDEEDEYAVGSIGRDGNGCHNILYPGRDFYVEGYTLNDVCVAEAVLVHNPGDVWDEQAGVGLVASVKHVWDEESNETYKLTVAETGKLNEYILREKKLLDSINDLEKGDIVMYQYTDGNIITKIDRILDISNEEYKYQGYIAYESTFYPRVGLFYGYIENKIGMQVSVVENGTPADSTLRRIPYTLTDLNTLAALFNTSAKDVEFVPAAEVSSCVYGSGSSNKVVFITRSGTMTDVYIYDETY